MYYRQGVVFLFVMAVIGVLTALVMSAMYSASMASSGMFQTNPQTLAEQAAQEGTGHAIGLIQKTYSKNSNQRSWLSDGPSTTPPTGEIESLPVVVEPTQLNDEWRTHFWAIDTHIPGVLPGVTPGAGEFAEEDSWPRGLEFSPRDLFENDVHLDSLLTETYASVFSKYRVYHQRGRIYDDGWMLHPGTGRWWEPGVGLSYLFNEDPVNLPISFHHFNITAKDAADPSVLNVSGNGDARADRAVRYDNRWQQTTVPDEVRYRLRYAVAVEPLDGRMLISFPEKYKGALTSDDRNEANETLTDRYHGVFANMMHVGKSGWESWDLAFQGHARPIGKYVNEVDPVITVGGGGAVNPSAYAVESAALDAVTIHDATDTNAFDDNIIATTSPAPANAVSLHGELLGPVPSFEALRHKNAYERVYAFTPFGRAPILYSDDESSPTKPEKWYHGYTNNPWRINLTVAPPLTLGYMLMGYLPPHEAFAYQPPSLGGPAVTAPDYTKVNQNRDNFTTFDNASSGEMDGGYFTELGGLAAAPAGYDPGYPGTKNADSDLWLANLGRFNGANACYSGAEADADEPVDETTEAAVWGYEALSGSVVNWRNPLPPFAGMTQPYLPKVFGTNLRKGNGDFFPPSKVQTRGGYFYHESYWLDIANAYLHAVAMAQHAWAHKVGADQNPKWLQEQPGGVGDDLENYFESHDASELTMGAPNDWTSAPNTRDRHLPVGSTGSDPEVPSVIDSIAELDKQFLRNLGEHPGHFPTGDRVNEPTALGAGIANNAKLAQGKKWADAEDMEKEKGYMLARKQRTLYVRETKFYNPDADPAIFGDPALDPGAHAADDAANNVYVTRTISHLRKMADDGNLELPDPDDTAQTISVTVEHIAMMELVLNDFRMSFFGASPQYPNFEPIDFDDDGEIRCSCYVNGYVTADPSTGRPPSTAVMQRFSITGYFVMDKARFYRIFSRGEVFDELRQVAVAQTNLETVYVVDPDGDVWYDGDIYPYEATGGWTNRHAAASTETNIQSAAGTGLLDSHALYQRVLSNVYEGNMSNVSR